MANPLPKHRAREYETIFILDPECPSDVTDQIAARLRDVIARLEGKLLRAENWGRRRLAYPVRKHNKGIYIYLKYLGYSDMVAELERNLRMIERVIKHMTVKLEEDVNPETKAVRDEDISFVPQFEEEIDEPAPPAPVEAAEPAESDAPACASSGSVELAEGEENEDADTSDAGDEPGSDEEEK
ncbi:MAG: 30S ribosomal protein S6 [Deltaproteobacteria bacterium]|nr:30S ribosomal protein S6 [Deltaproteobacteria bacterium]